MIDFKKIKTILRDTLETVAIIASIVSIVAFTFGTIAFCYIAIRYSFLLNYSPS